MSAEQTRPQDAIVPTPIFRMPTARAACAPSFSAGSGTVGQTPRPLGEAAIPRTLVIRATVPTAESSVSAIRPTLPPKVTSSARVKRRRR